MALSKLVCPECSKVLRPARPVEEGQKVRCPSCELVFIAGEEEDEEEERPAAKHDREELLECGEADAAGRRAL